jgi:methylation protein EvaC
MDIAHRNICRGCFEKKLHKILDLGKLPLAGGFLSKSQLKSEQLLPLKIYFCRQCGLVQNLDIVNPKVLFRKYHYSSVSIPLLKKHFQDYAAYLRKNFLTQRTTLLEFGSNDGVLLENFKKDKRITAIGVDPSINVTKLSIEKGIRTFTEFFTKKLAEKIKKSYGKIDVITGSNVFAHIDDIHEVLRAIKHILKPEGVFIIEVHYIMDLIKDIQYDFFYHEHVSYYSVTSLKKIYALAGLKIVRIEPLSIHGGSIRVIASLVSSSRKSDRTVTKYLSSEKDFGVLDIKRYKSFARKIDAHKKKLIKLIREIKKQKKSIVAYGASGRAVTLLNYCKIDSRYLEYIVDISPLRIGKYMPGIHLPIKSPSYLHSYVPDYIFISAWSYANSIMAQEKQLIRKGVKCIIPFPEIKIL